MAKNGWYYRILLTDPRTKQKRFYNVLYKDGRIVSKILAGKLNLEELYKSNESHAQAYNKYINENLYASIESLGPNMQTNMWNAVDRLAIQAGISKSDPNEWKLFFDETKKYIESHPEIYELHQYSFYEYPHVSLKNK